MLQRVASEVQKLTRLVEDGSVPGRVELGEVGVLDARVSSVGHQERPVAHRRLLV